MSGFSEDVVEQATLAWFKALDYEVLHGPEIAPGERDAERATYEDVLLLGRLEEAIIRLNPDAEAEAVEEAVRTVRLINSPMLVDANHHLHHLLVNGITTEFLRADGTTGYAPLRLIDYDEPDNNDWVVVNQFTVKEGNHTRRPDVLVFLNGMPVGILELKNAASDSATVWDAYQQLQTYKQELPALFTYNEAMVRLLPDPWVCHTTPTRRSPSG